MSNKHILFFVYVSDSAHHQTETKRRRKERDIDLSNPTKVNQSLSTIADSLAECRVDCQA